MFRTQRTRAAVLVMSVGAAAGVPVAQAMAPASSAEAVFAPEPSPVPKRWQLDVSVGPLRPAVVDTGSGPRAYLFLTYKATNNTDRDMLFTPAFDLGTDDGVLRRSGRDVPHAVTEALMDRIGNPLLMDQVKVGVGPFLRGRENAREGLVVWPLDKLNAREFSVFAAGFSGETVTIDAPIYEVKPAAAAGAPAGDAPAPSRAMAEPPSPPKSTGRGAGGVPLPEPPPPPVPTGKTEKKILRKTYEIRYRSPGEIDPTRSTAVEETSRKWIMR